MKNCSQTQTQSVYEHGLSVKNHLFQLINYLRVGKLEGDWKLPSWIDEYKDLLLNNLLDDKILEEYTTFHDCSKPYCRIIDENGKQHFPNHSKESERLWLELGGNSQVATLMGMDMDIHLLKDKDVEEFASRKEAISLLLTGLSEVISNSKMFGGFDSNSFKIKYKNIERRGKKICQLVNKKIS